MVRIVAAQNILKANDQIASMNRSRFAALSLLVVNVMGSPGSGKTTLLESIAAQCANRLRVGVIEGDLAGSVDAERLEKLGLPTVQINTQGACHLDASMIATACESLPLEKLDLLFIENVGNLVCPASFDLGEDLRLLVLSVPEGDDKLVKYPVIFQVADVLVVTKADLCGFVSFDVERIRKDFARIQPTAALFETAATRNQGIEPLVDWLAEKYREKQVLRRCE